MEMYEQDDLYEIINYVVYKLKYKCYIRFSMPGNSKKSIRPQLRVVIPKFHYIAIGIPLDEILDNLEKYGLAQTCSGIEKTISMALNKFLNDHPEYGEI